MHNVMRTSLQKNVLDVGVQRDSWLNLVLGMEGVMQK